MYEFYYEFFYGSKSNRTTIAEGIVIADTETEALLTLKKERPLEMSDNRAHIKLTKLGEATRNVNLTLK